MRLLSVFLLGMAVTLIVLLAAGILKWESRDSGLDVFVKIATLGVFICTIIGLRYTARVSNQTVEMIRSESRPWVMIDNPSSRRTPDTNALGTNIALKNIGKLPAFITKKSMSAICDNAEVSRMHSSTDEVSVLMPGQKIILTFALSDEHTDRVLTAREEGVFLLSIEIIYTDDKDDPSKYRTYSKPVFHLPSFSWLFEASDAS